MSKKGNRREHRTRKGGRLGRSTYLQEYTGTLSDEEIEELFLHCAYGENTGAGAWLRDKPHQVVLRLLAMLETGHRKR